MRVSPVHSVETHYDFEFLIVFSIFVFLLLSFVFLALIKLLDIFIEMSPTSTIDKQGCHEPLCDEIIIALEEELIADVAGPVNDHYKAKTTEKGTAEDEKFSLENNVLKTTEEQEICP